MCHCLSEFPPFYLAFYLMSSLSHTFAYVFEIYGYSILLPIYIIFSCVFSSKFFRQSDLFSYLFTLPHAHNSMAP